MAELRPTRRSFARRALPAPDPATHLVRSFAAATYRHAARLSVGLSAEAVRAGVYAAVPGDVEAVAPDACTVRLTAESVELVVQFVAAVVALGAPVVVEEATEEVARQVRLLGAALAGVG
jgi:hypothetical protein